MAIDGLGQSKVATAYKAQESAKVDNAKQPVKQDSLALDSVNISTQAKTLLANETQSDAGVAPMSAGGTTLPPWPPKKEQ